MGAFLLDERKKKILEEINKYLYDSLVHSLVILGTDNTIIYANSTFFKLWGWTEEEVIGTDIKKYWTEPDFIKGNLERTKTENHISFEVTAIRKDRTTFWTRFNASIVKNSYGEILGYVCMIMDITVQKLAEKETMLKIGDLVLINNIYNIVNSGGSIDDVLKYFARYTKTLFESYGATVYLKSKDNQYLEIKNYYLPETIRKKIESLIGMKIPEVKIKLGTGCLYDKLIEKNKPCIINNREDILDMMKSCTENKFFKSLVPAILEILKINSVMSVPLIVNNENIGFIDISRDKNFSEIDLLRFSALSSQMDLIIEKKIANDNLKESEEKWRLLVGNIPYYIAVLDMDGTIKAINKSISGRPVSEIIGKKLYDFIITEYKEKAFEIIENVKTTGNPYFNEYKGILAGIDRDKIFEVSIIPVKKEGKVTSITLISSDITEKRKKEEEYNRTYELYRTLIETLPQAVILSDLEGNILYASKKCCEYFRLNNENELVGKNGLEILMVPEMKEFAMNNMRKVFRNEPIGSVEYILLRKDGTRFPVEVTASVIRDSESKPVSFITVIRDISERKRIEKEREALFYQLVQSEKLSGIGMLAAGVAHEFNNLLQIIRSYSEYGISQEKLHVIKKSFKTILDTVDRAAGIVSDLLVFSSQKTPQKELCLVTGLVDSVLNITEMQLRVHNIKVIRRYKNKPYIEADKSQIHQVFLNIITNARDAMFDKGGKLMITVEKRGNEAIVSFRDTGKGIKKEDLTKIFEPFYTTKGTLNGELWKTGKGLGLSVSYGIIKNHDGRIDVKSKLGKGTTFTIYLPLAEDKFIRIHEHKEEKSEKSKVIPGIFLKRKKKTKKILIIDDEKKICQAISNILEREGYKVKYATNPISAIKRVRKNRFNFIFLDLIIPGFSTEKIIEDIKEYSPESKIIIITGKLSEKEIKESYLKKGAVAYIPKPFKTQEIIKVINSLI